MPHIVKRTPFDIQAFIFDWIVIDTVESQKFVHARLESATTTRADLLR